MRAVNKLLNVVSACEIWGRLRCSAASIGYRARIRKVFSHSRVTRLSSKSCQARNDHCAVSAKQRNRRGRRRCAGRGTWRRLRAACAFVLKCREFSGHSGGLPCESNEAVRFDSSVPHRLSRKASSAIPHFKTRSTCRISLKGTAECPMPLAADWPSPLAV